MDKYTRWYNHIVERARYRIIEDYTETHHIKPRSLGGSDEIDNLVALTAREHFICHWLLTKMTTGEDRYKMLNALRMMRAEKHGQQRYETKITARVYENIKQEYARLQSEKVSGENNPMYGDKFYRSEDGKKRQREAIRGINNGAKKEEARKKITESKLGKKREPFSEEWRAKMAEKKKGANNPRHGVKISEETREKMREKAKGRKQSPETIAKKIAATQGKTRDKLLCPHCEKMIAVNTYPRWHGDRCRQSRPTPNGP
jgi:hypothetical protein